MLEFIKNSRLWLKFHDFFGVIFITAILMAIYLLVHNIYKANWTIGIYRFDDLLSPPTQPDINADFVTNMSFVLATMTNWAYAIGSVTSALAAFFAATNDQLTLPIRLLATAENVTKFVYSVTWLLNGSCQFPIIDLECSSQLALTFGALFSFLTFFDLVDIAQYCQMLISMSRFLALSNNGIYFRYTLKLPLIQLLFPFVLGVFITYLKEFIQNVFDFYGTVDYVVFPYFLMCGLDFMTNWNMRKRVG